MDDAIEIKDFSDKQLTKHARVFKLEQSDEQERTVTVRFKRMLSHLDYRQIELVMSCIAHETGVPCKQMLVYIENQEIDTQRMFLIDTRAETDKGNALYVMLDYWHTWGSCNLTALYSTKENPVDLESWIPIANPCCKWVQTMESVCKIVRWDGFNGDHQHFTDRKIESLVSKWSSVKGVMQSLAALRGIKSTVWCEYPVDADEMYREFEADMSKYLLQTGTARRSHTGLVLAFVCCGNISSSSRTRESMACRRWDELVCELIDNVLRTEPHEGLMLAFENASHMKKDDISLIGGIVPPIEIRVLIHRVVVECMDHRRRGSMRYGVSGGNTCILRSFVNNSSYRVWIQFIQTELARVLGSGFVRHTGSYGGMNPYTVYSHGMRKFAMFLRRKNSRVSVIMSVMYDRDFGACHVTCVLRYEFKDEDDEKGQSSSISSATSVCMRCMLPTLDCGSCA